MYSKPHMGVLFALALVSIVLGIGQKWLNADMSIAPLYLLVCYLQITLSANNMKQPTPMSRSQTMRPTAAQLKSLSLLVTTSVFSYYDLIR